MAQYPGRWFQGLIPILGSPSLCRRYEVTWKRRENWYEPLIAQKQNRVLDQKSAFWCYLASDEPNGSPILNISEVARLFNLVGFVAPIIVWGKIIIQSLRAAGLNWNTLLLDTMAWTWLAFHYGMGDLNQLRIHDSQIWLLAVWWHFMVFWTLVLRSATFVFRTAMVTSMSPPL